MNKKLLYCLLLTIFLIIFPITIYSIDFTKENCNAFSFSIKETDIAYCESIIDGYKYILQSQESRYNSEKNIDSETLEYINNINKKITYYRKQCGIDTDIKVASNILITKK